MLAKNRRWKNLANYLTGRNGWIRNWIRNFFPSTPLRSVENIFRFLFFLQLNELQLWRLKNLTKFCRGIIFLVSIVLRYKVGIFSSIPLSTENISLFSLLLERNFSKGKKKRKKKHFKNRRESKNWKKKKFCFPTDTSTYIESRLESLKKKPEEEFNDEIKIKIEIFFSTTL